VIAADTPTYRALTDGGAGWLYTPGDSASLRAALAEAASNPREARRRGRAARRRAEELDWAEIAERTAVALRG
jgi:glycosyltransferase involved in cell wall biosynthesis